jgi:hypothetical protein
VLTMLAETRYIPPFRIASFTEIDELAAFLYPNTVQYITQIKTIKNQIHLIRSIRVPYSG